MSLREDVGFFFFLKSRFKMLSLSPKKKSSTYFESCSYSYFLFGNIHCTESQTLLCKVGRVSW